MKVLFDVNVPKGLRNLLKHHDVLTAQEQGWGAITNGELLHAAEAKGFELLVTADKNITHQRNMKDRKIAMLVLPTNDWSRLKTVVPQIVEMVNKSTESSYQAIDISALGPPRARNSDPES